jgi:glycosyltransferase involved in cell wall biosynthesis
VHNNCVHYLPVAMAPAVAAPMVTTLHTPPTPWLESAIRIGHTGRQRGSMTFAAVSAHTAIAWGHLISDPVVIRNGIDLERWAPGPGGGPLIWSGRIVPEKGTHLAIRAARRAGWALQIAGPISDPVYFRDHVRPELDSTISYVGHLPTQDLAAHVAGASATLVTPCWNEPYGLVVAEALACGTPIAGFGIGAVPELVDDSCARLVAPGDDTALAAVIPTVTALSRTAARARAVDICAHTTMVDRYVQLYRDLSA